MRIERLAGDKVKVTLTVAELARLNVDPRNLRPDSKELHAFMFYIMQTIQKRTDFNPFSGQVTMEAMPHEDGMCVIISKIHLKRELMRRELKRVKKVTPRRRPVSYDAYYLYDFESVCEALKRMNDETLKMCGLFKLDDEYCMVTPDGKKFDRDRFVLMEYTKRVSERLRQTSFVSEHGLCIAKGGELAEMARGIRNLD